MERRITDNYLNLQAQLPHELSYTPRAPTSKMNRATKDSEETHNHDDPSSSGVAGEDKKTLTNTHKPHASRKGQRSTGKLKQAYNTWLCGNLNTWGVVGPEGKGWAVAAPTVKALLYAENQSSIYSSTGYGGQDNHSSMTKRAGYAIHHSKPQTGQLPLDVASEQRDTEPPRFFQSASIDSFWSTGWYLDESPDRIEEKTEDLGHCHEEKTGNFRNDQ